MTGSCPKAALSGLKVTIRYVAVTVLPKGLSKAPPRRDLSRIAAPQPRYLRKRRHRDSTTTPTHPARFRRHDAHHVTRSRGPRQPPDGSSGGSHKPALQRQAADQAGRQGCRSTHPPTMRADRTRSPIRHPGDLGDKIEALTTSAFARAASSRISTRTTPVVFGAGPWPWAARVGILTSARRTGDDGDSVRTSRCCWRRLAHQPSHRSRRTAAGAAGRKP